MEFLTSKGKLAGKLDNGIYRKKVISTKHKMKIFDAYGIDKTIVSKLEKLGCKEIRILETDTNIIYSTSFENFLKNGIEKNFDGKQVFLSIKHFSESNERQKTLI